MSLLTDLRARLVADAGVSALTTRVSISSANQFDELPLVILHAISGDHEHYMGGATGVVQGRIQIDCHADTPIGAEALAEAIRQSIDGYRGLIGSTFVMHCHLDDERSQVTPPESGRDETGGVYTVQLDYSIGWNVSVPTFS